MIRMVMWITIRVLIFTIMMDSRKTFMVMEPTVAGRLRLLLMMTFHMLVWLLTPLFCRARWVILGCLIRPLLRLLIFAPRRA